MVASLQSSPATPTTLRDKIRELGYNILSDAVVAPSARELERYNLKQKRVIFMKSRREVPRNPHYYFRFWLEVDDFSNSADAALCLKEVGSPPPGSDAFAREYLYPMRHGFQLGRQVYIIDTDAAMFASRSTWMLDQLQHFLLARVDPRPGKP